eukprot:g12950.t1
MLTRYWRKAERSLDEREADPDKVTWTRFHDPLFGRHKERLTGCVELFDENWHSPLLPENLLLAVLCLDAGMVTPSASTAAARDLPDGKGEMEIGRSRRRGPSWPPRAAVPRFEFLRCYPGFEEVLAERSAYTPKACVAHAMREKRCDTKARPNMEYEAFWVDRTPDRDGATRGALVDQMCANRWPDEVADDGDPNTETGFVNLYDGLKLRLKKTFFCLIDHKDVRF